MFDEERYFEPVATTTARCSSIGGVRVARLDLRGRVEPVGPILTQAAGGAELVVNINASPYYAGRMAERETMLATRAADASSRSLYVNLVGGQDELVFDGASLLFDETGHLVARARQFVEDLLVVDLDVRPAFRERLLDPSGRPSAAPLAEVDVHPSDRPRRGPLAPGSSRCSTPVHEVYEALVLGTRDYVHKNGFADVVIGLSGGIDSSLVAAIAADALGADHVVGVLMPSRFSSDGTRHRRRGARRPTSASRTLTIPIEPAHAAFLDDARASHSPGTSPGLAEENLQARIRGTILMTLSNKFGWIVLTTGNKSEMAVGYATLYGDMAGGFAVSRTSQDARLSRSADDRNERAGVELIPEAVHRQATERRAAPRPARQRLAARRTTCSTRSSRATSRTTSRSPSSIADGHDPEHRAPGRSASSTATSTSAARPRPGCASRRRRSARTAACRSPTAGPARPSRRRRGQARFGDDRRLHHGGPGGPAHQDVRGRLALVLTAVFFGITFASSASARGHHPGRVPRAALQHRRPRPAAVLSG